MTADELSQIMAADGATREAAEREMGDSRRAGHRDDFIACGAKVNDRAAVTRARRERVITISGMEGN